MNPPHPPSPKKPQPSPKPRATSQPSQTETLRISTTLLGEETPKSPLLERGLQRSAPLGRQGPTQVVDSASEGRARSLKLLGLHSRTHAHAHFRSHVHAYSRTLRSHSLSRSLSFSLDHTDTHLILLICAI